MALAGRGEKTITTPAAATGINNLLVMITGLHGG
jgi:hypothetical protein